MTRIVTPLICLFIILSSAWVSKSAPDWHMPTPCWGCHGEILDADYGNDVECGNCHEYGLNVQKLQEEHNPKICTACHIGNTIINGSKKEIFHSGHYNVKCTVCHTSDNFTVLKIKSTGFECISCHGNQIHSIHIENLGKSCPICHGSWAGGKVYKSDKAVTSSQKAEEISKLEGFTIFALIKNMFNSLLGIR